MKNRMNVPETYEPVLPGKVKAHIEKKKETPAAQEGQTIWYQCVDDRKFWAKEGHKSCEQDGTFSLENVLTNPDNDGALMVTFQDNRLFKIQDGTMLPSQTTDN